MTTIHIISSEALEKLKARFEELCGFPASDLTDYVSSFEEKYASGSTLAVELRSYLTLSGNPEFLWLDEKDFCAEEI